MQIGNLDLGSRVPAIMGVLNITPDSFSDAGELYDSDSNQRVSKALKRAEQMLAEGSDLLDVGGASARPGAEPICESEEGDRVLPVVAALKGAFDAPVSVDTGTPGIMREAAALGADMINDIWALQKPGAMEVAVECGLPVCLMHMQGTPQDMQDDPQYDDVVKDIKSFFAERVYAASVAGVDEELMVLDPGFGFGKTFDHNLTLLARLREFRVLSKPMMVGMSRKSMLGALTGRSINNRIHASIGAHLEAVAQGAAIVRVHDIAPMADAIKVWRAAAAVVAP